MIERRLIRYEGPRDARHYELACQVGAIAGPDLSHLELDGQRDLHTNPTAEHGHGMYLAAVNGGTVDDLYIHDVVGDGLVLGSTDPRDGDAIVGVCRDVEVRQLLVVSAQRNAVAFIGAERCTLADATLLNTHGALPRGPHAGVDFESDHAETPNVDNLLERVEVAGCQDFGIVCDMGGSTCFGTRVRQSRVVAAITGWAVLWRGGAHPQHPWHVWEDVEIYGPAAGMTHCHLKGVHFHPLPSNQKSGRALEIDHDLPVILEACKVDALPLTAALAREHPALYLHGANIRIVP